MSKRIKRYEPTKIYPKPKRMALVYEFIFELIKRLRAQAREDIARYIEHYKSDLAKYSQMKMPAGELLTEVKDAIVRRNIIPDSIDPSELGQFERIANEVIEEMLTPKKLEEAMKRADKLAEALIHEHMIISADEEFIRTNAPDMEELNPDLYFMLLGSPYPLDEIVRYWKQYKREMMKIRTEKELQEFLEKVRRGQITRKEDYALGFLRRNFPSIYEWVKNDRLTVTGITMFKTYFIMYVLDHETYNEVPVIVPFSVPAPKGARIKIMNEEGNYVWVTTTVEYAMKMKEKEEKVRKAIEEAEKVPPEIPEVLVEHVGTAIIPKKWLEEVDRIYEKTQDALEIYKDRGVCYELYELLLDIIKELRALYKDILRGKAYLRFEIIEKYKGAYQKAWTYFVSKCAERKINPYLFTDEFEKLVFSISEDVVEKQYKRIIDDILIPTVERLAVQWEIPELGYTNQIAPLLPKYPYRKMLKRALESLRIKAIMLRNTLKKGYKLSIVVSRIRDVASRAINLYYTVKELLPARTQKVVKERERKERTLDLVGELAELVNEELQRIKEKIMKQFGVEIEFEVKPRKEEEKK